MRTTKNLKNSLRRTQTGRRRRAAAGTTNRRRRAHANACSNKGRRTSNDDGSRKVLNKLETLKTLVHPGQINNGDMIKTEKLFQETADYILLLRTQVVILQRLVEFYGSESEENQNVVL